MTHLEYRTTDIVLAATLKYNGNLLSRIQLNGTQGIFIFASVEDATIEQYNTGRLLVEPCSFHAEIRSLNQAIKRMKG